MHDGADTFFGHQEIVGTRPAKPFRRADLHKIELIKKRRWRMRVTSVRYYTGTSGNAC